MSIADIIADEHTTLYGVLDAAEVVQNAQLLIQIKNEVDALARKLDETIDRLNGIKMDVDSIMSDMSTFSARLSEVEEKSQSYYVDTNKRLDEIQIRLDEQVLPAGEWEEADVAVNTKPTWDDGRIVQTYVQASLSNKYSPRIGVAFDKNTIDTDIWVRTMDGVQRASSKTRHLYPLLTMYQDWGDTSVAPGALPEGGSDEPVSLLEKHRWRYGHLEQVHHTLDGMRFQRVLLFKPKSK